MRLTFGLIVLNGDFFLKQVLESIYPFAHKICIAEGPVKYWQSKGIFTSTDDTNEILRNFPDPLNKLKVIHSIYEEKDHQCKAWFSMVPTDTDYVFTVDSDEVHTPENIEKLIKFLELTQATSVGFKSDSFYGGMERVIGGFERDHSFKRVLKYEPNCYFKTHRQPLLATSKGDISGNDVLGNQLYDATGITMWHGSYVSPRGVFEKLQYYEDSVIKKGACIPNYFQDVWLNWVRNPDKRLEIEQKWKGVQEFIPEKRGEAYTIPFEGEHPEIIKRDMAELQAKFNDQLSKY